MTQKQFDRFVVGMLLVWAFLFAVVSLHGQTTGAAMPYVKPQILDNNGKPAANYRLCTFLAGTTNQQATYKDANLGTLNTNPIVLDASGRADIFLSAVNYKFVLALPSTTSTCSSGVIWTEDNIGDIGQLLKVGLAASSGSSLVGFTQGTSGAVNRTVQSKLRDTVSIMDFGADPTGTNDSTTAIQKAIDTGACAYVPPGTYKYISQITMADGDCIRADSREQATLLYAGTSYPSIKPALAAANQKISIYNLTIQKSGTQAGTGLSLQGTQKSTVFRNTFKNWSVGVDMDGSDYGVYFDTLDQNLFDTISSKAIWCHGNSTQQCSRNTISNSRFQSVSNGLVCEASHCEVNTITSNDVEGLTDNGSVSLDIQGDGNTLTTGNWMETNPGSGVAVVGVNLAGFGNTLKGNHYAFGTSNGGSFTNLSYTPQIPAVHDINEPWMITSNPTLTTPVIASVVPQTGGGGKTCTYVVVALLTDGSHTAASTAVSSGDCANDLTAGSHGNVITWGAVTGETGGFDVYRTVFTGATPLSGYATGKITHVTTGTTTYTDVGLNGDSTVAPTTNTTGPQSVGMFVHIPIIDRTASGVTVHDVAAGLGQGGVPVARIFDKKADLGMSSGLVHSWRTNFDIADPNHDSLYQVTKDIAKADLAASADAHIALSNLGATRHLLGGVFSDPGYGGFLQGYNNPAASFNYPLNIQPLAGNVTVGAQADDNTHLLQVYGSTNVGSVDYILETGADNAIVGSLSNQSLVTGLCVTIKLQHALQIGANTFNYNGGGAVAIVSHRNPASNIGTAYVSGGMVTLCYNGTAWLDMSQ